MSVILALWEAKVGGSLEVRSLRPTWPTWQDPIFTKNTKISLAWWLIPVITATWESEAGNWLESGRQTLQRVTIMPLHSSLGNKSKTPCQIIILKKAQVQWLTCVIPSLWEAEEEGTLKYGSLRPVWTTQ